MMSRRLFLLALAALTAGCTTVPLSADSRRYGGRFSMRAATAEKTETAAGKYRLTVTGDTYELTILSPINGVLGRVTVTPGLARVERGSRPEITAPTETELMREAFGFDLPIAVFADWLEGRPSPLAPSTTASAAEFTQKDWTVNFTPACPPDRPAVLKLVRRDPGRLLRFSLTVEKESVL